MSKLRAKRAGERKAPRFPPGLSGTRRRRVVAETYSAPAASAPVRPGLLESMPSLAWGAVRVEITYSG